MQTESSMALKEWAAVCLALVEGRQSLLIRKGGIAEGSGGFRMEQGEFWLFPTQFHQSPDQLTQDGAESLDRVRSSVPPSGRLVIESYAVVRSVTFVEDERRLADLDGWHILAEDVVRQRFHYRRPGLFVAAVDMFRRPAGVEIADEPRYAGCHSWVELSDPLPTTGLVGVVPVRPVEEAIRLVETLDRPVGA